MTWFSAKRSQTAVITASRADVWAVLSDPDAIADLTPLVRSIEVDGDHWRWSIDEVPGLGVSLAPSFTVLMKYDEPERISFTHDPPEGRRERAGVEGLYTLEDVEHDGEPATRLGIELTVRVDLPLAKVAKPAVKAAIDGVLASMGRGFSKGLLKRLDAEQVE